MTGIWNRTLRNICSPVKVIDILVVQAMGMQCRGPSITERVRHVDMEEIVRVDTHRVVRKLAIDADSSARKLTVRIHIVNPADFPVFAHIGSISTCRKSCGYGEMKFHCDVVGEQR